VRGVAVNPNITRTLIERNWVRVVGHRDVPGHPELLGTTREFLDYFGMKNLDELPPLAELKAIGEVTLHLALAEEASAPEGAEGLPAAGGVPPAEDAAAGEDPGDEDELSAEGSDPTARVAGLRALEG